MSEVGKECQKKVPNFGCAFFICPTELMSTQEDFLSMLFQALVVMTKLETTIVSRCPKFYDFTNHNEHYVNRKRHPD